MALKDKLMTLEDFKAVRDVDVASNSAQFTEIKADLDGLEVEPYAKDVIVDYTQNTEDVKTYEDIRTELTGNVVSGYVWDKNANEPVQNTNGKYVKISGIGNYGTIYINATSVNANCRGFAFYNSNDELLSAQTGSGANGFAGYPAVVPSGASYVILNSVTATGAQARDIPPKCFVLSGEDETVGDMITVSPAKTVSGYMWLTDGSPTANQNFTYAKYVLPEAKYIYVTGNSYRANSPIIAFYNSSDVLVEAYGTNAATYEFDTEIEIPNGATYCYVNGSGSTTSLPKVTYAKTGINVKRTQKDINESLASWLYGKKVSIIGDSIDTFSEKGYKIDGYRMFYPANGVTSVYQTWWMQVLTASGAKLEVNASWSGSKVTNTTSGFPDFYDRVSLIGNPDLIFITLGTNDSNGHVALGDYDFTTTYTSLSESEFRPAYIKGIKALQALYPDASIVCICQKMGQDYKDSISVICDTLGCKFVDASDYISVDSVHPGIVGMRQIARHVLYPTDKTLKQEMPANAKAVGEALEYLTSEIARLEALISSLS